METIQFRNFAYRCGAGFWALGIACLLWSVIFLFVSGGGDGRWRTNEKISAENKEMMGKWREDVSRVVLRNNTIVALEQGSTAGARFDERHGRYAELMVRLAGNFTAEQRKEAYLHHIGAVGIPDSTHFGVWKALTDERLAPAERVELFARYTEGDPMILGVVREWVGEGRRPSLQPLPPRPKRKPQVKPDWEGWTIFAIVLYGLANVVMMLDFFWKEWSGVGATATHRWGVPVNPASWLIMLAFAPAFAVPWVFWGTYFILLRPLIWGIGGTGRGIKWLLVDFSVEEVARKAKERGERKIAERQRKAADEQMAIAEQAKVGSDVAAARIELKALIAQVNLVADAGERKRLQDLLAEAGSKLETTAKTRASRTKPNGQAAAGLAQQVEELSNRIEGIHEAEKV